MFSKLIIIGSGPAGLTAAIYAGRARLNPIVLAGVTWGGQLMNTTEIENFPGFIDGIKGPELMDNMINQGKKFGATFVYENATQIETILDNSSILKPKNIFRVHTYDNVYEAESVIISTGAIPKKLGIEGEEKFYGHGVSTCATCDAAFYRDKVVAVIGGGDSAMEDGSFLTRFASKVYLIHRRDKFRASTIMQERLINNIKVEILYNTEILEIRGDLKVSHLSIKNNITNQTSELKLDGVFLAIGHIPVTDFLKDEIKLDNMGYIMSNDGVQTSIPGIFVAGDVQDHKYRQAITAAGQGCKAALDAQKWLENQD